MNEWESHAFSELRKNLTEIVNRVAYGSKRVIIKRKGKKLAVIISIKDLEELESKACK